MRLICTYNSYAFLKKAANVVSDKFICFHYSSRLQQTIITGSLTGRLFTSRGRDIFIFLCQKLVAGGHCELGRYFDAINNILQTHLFNTRL